MAQLVKCWEKRKGQKDFSVRDNKLFVLAMFYWPEIRVYVRKHADEIRSIVVEYKPG